MTQVQHMNTLLNYGQNTNARLCSTQYRQAFGSEYNFNGKETHLNVVDPRIQQQYIIQNVPPSINDIIRKNGTLISQQPIGSAKINVEGVSPHLTKFVKEYEYHHNKFCSYQQQQAKSGKKNKIKLIKYNDPQTLAQKEEKQQLKYYEKHLVRICRCGKYEQMDGALHAGRSNDCNGYEIHYSPDCKWEVYDDLATGQTVLIRQCSCYKPI